MKIPAMRWILVAVEFLLLGAGRTKETTAGRYPEGTNVRKTGGCMKQIVGFIGLAFLHLMAACSSVAPWETREWQPTAVTDFKSVAGK
jgi:hypothetical protein